MTDCVFCKIVEGSTPCRKVAESTNFLAFLDIAPNAPGHTLIIPKKHATNLLDMPEFLGNEYLEFSQRISSAIMQAMGSDGFNLVVNNGKAAGQFVFHMHAHVVPRKDNDGVHVSWGPQLTPTAEELTTVQQTIIKHVK